MVPGERMCSLDLPTACTGRNSAARSSGSRAITASIMPWPMMVSVETARCGPCCSIAAIGKTTMVFSASSPAKSSVVNSSQWILRILEPYHRGANLGDERLALILARDVHVIQRKIIDLRAVRKAWHVARHDLPRRIADQKRVPPRPAVGRDCRDTLQVRQQRDCLVGVRQIEGDTRHQQPIHPAFEHRGRTERPDGKLDHQSVRLAQAAYVISNARLVFVEIVIVAPLLRVHHRIEF